jgi:hypothetical protein
MYCDKDPIDKPSIDKPPVDKLLPVIDEASPDEDERRAMQVLQAPPRKVFRKVIAVSGEFTLIYNYHKYHWSQMTNLSYLPQKIMAMVETMVKTMMQTTTKIVTRQ